MEKNSNYIGYQGTQLTNRLEKRERTENHSKREGHSGEKGENKRPNKNSSSIPRYLTQRNEFLKFSYKKVKLFSFHMF